MDDNNQVEEIVAAIEETGVYIEPAAEAWIDDAELAAINAATESGDLPVYLVLVTPRDDSGIHTGDDLLVRVHDAGASDGLYIGVNNVWPSMGEDPPTGPYLDDGAELNLAMQQWGEVGGSSDLTDDVDSVLSYANGPGDPYPLGEGLVHVTESLADGTFPAAVAEARTGLDIRVDRPIDGGRPAGPVR